MPGCRSGMRTTSATGTSSDWPGLGPLADGIPFELGRGGTDMAERALQALTLSGCAAGGIGEDAIIAVLCESIPLKRQCLIVGGDASLARKHVVIVSQLVTLHRYETMNRGRDRETPRS